MWDITMWIIIVTIPYYTTIHHYTPLYHINHYPYIWLIHHSILVTGKKNPLSAPGSKSTFTAPASAKVAWPIFHGNSWESHRAFFVFLSQKSSD